MRKLLLLTGTFACLFTMAATAAEQDRTDIEEEIIVTATHRESALMDTPQAISALSGETIEELGAIDMQSLYRNIPGLTMTEGASTGNNRYIIRGVSSLTGTDSFKQSFEANSVFLDDMPMTGAQGPASQFGGNLFDIDRVEVLKGPQGTLFGEGSMGGTVRFILNRPELGELDYKIKAGVNMLDESNDTGYRVDGMVNVPFGESVALRVVGFSDDTPGYIDKPRNGEKDVNSESSTGGRIELRWQATDRLSISPAFYTVKTETDGPVFANSPYFEDQDVRNPNSLPGTDEDVDVLSLNVDYAFDWAVLSLFAGNLDRNTVTVTESNRLTAAVFDWFIQFNTLVGSANLIPAMFAEGWRFNVAAFANGLNQSSFGNNNTASSDRDVYEMRLVSTGEGRLRWTAGVFHKNSDDYRRAFQPFLLCGVIEPCPPAPAGQPPRPNGLVLNATTAPVTFAQYMRFYTDPSNDHEDTLEDTSVYGEATYAVTDTLELTVGLRYTDMTQELNDGTASTSDKVLSKKLGVAWRPKDGWLTYANYATGFRPGNLNLGQEFNARVFRGSGDTVIPPTPFAANPRRFTGNQAAAYAEGFIAYDGDEVTSYEIGLKTSLFDDRVDLVTSIYYFDWQDTILSYTDTNIPSINNSYNFNAGAAHTMGLEIEVVAQLTDNLRLRLGGDVKEAELDEDLANVATGVVSVPDGTELPYSPEWTMSAMLLYQIPLPNGWYLDTMINHTRQDRQARGLQATGARVFDIPSRHQTDLRATLRGGEDNWSVSLFAINVTNEDKVTLNLSDESFNPRLFAFQTPRSIGIEFTYRMGR